MLFLIYYTNSGASDNQDRANVWSDGFAGVYHMTDNTSSTTDDSTSNEYHGTKEGADEPIESPLGLIVDTQTFDDSDDDIAIDDAGATTETLLTFLFPPGAIPGFA